MLLIVYFLCRQFVSDLSKILLDTHDFSVGLEKLASHHRYLLLEVGLLLAILSLLIFQVSEQTLNLLL